MKNMLYKHLSTNEKGHLTFGGLDTIELAREYGTPLYLLDEDVVRAHMKKYLSLSRKYFGDSSLPLYASKALSFGGIYKMAMEEGLGIDCVSGGELFTASSVGFPAEKIYFHGNNKTDADLSYALDLGVGRIVVDNCDELAALSNIAQSKGRVQDILLRITPGIDPHTHKSISTGRIDSKFGSAIVTGAAMDIVKKAIASNGIHLCGIHCHVGSQIFDSEPFLLAADIMTRFIADVKSECGYTLDELNLGGGFGVRYTEFDRELDIDSILGEISDAIRNNCEKYGIKFPCVRLEPGRSIVADAGITLYTVGSVKKIPGFKNYISVDGGMTDNPRYALYQSHYTALIADRANENTDFCATIAGRCCESGDLLCEDIQIQKPQRGDILAVLTTGAYNYSMASNYNRIPRPPIVIVSGGNARIGIRRERYEDIIGFDIL